MSVEDRLLNLATCLCAEITASTVTPDVCFCGVLPGEAVAFDYSGDCNDKCGMAWVRLMAAYPSTAIGQPSAQPGNCATVLSIDVEVGIMRCIEGMDDQGNAPSPEALLAATIWQVEDLATMRRAVVCCEDSSGFLLGTYTPIGPAGGLVGGVWLVSMQEI